MSKSRNRKKKSNKNNLVVTANSNCFRLSDSTIINAVAYIVPGSNEVLVSANMNMTFGEYSNRCGRMSAIMKNESWTLDSTYIHNGYKFSLYKCDNGSFIKLDI